MQSRSPGRRSSYNRGDYILACGPPSEFGVMGFRSRYLLSLTSTLQLALSHLAHA